MTELEYKLTIEMLREADKAYYVKDRPIMSDAEYDRRMMELRQFEAAHPSMVSAASPSQRVSGDVSDMFNKVKHPRRMLSLDNTFNEDDVKRKLSSMSLSDSDMVVVEPKLDGLTIVVHYRNGRLDKAVTRGTGDIGEDVTATARTIRNLPLQVDTESAFWARGEVLMQKETLAALNKRLVENGQMPLANTRNAAAGALRQTSVEEASSRHLMVCFYDCAGSFETEMEKLHFMDEIGLPTLSNATLAVSSTQAYILCREMESRRASMAVDIDGAVIKALDCRKQQQLGEGRKAPKWAFAYKFEPEVLTTVVRKVVWQTGRTGRITPVAVTDPVQIGGTVVDHASLHDIAYIKALNLHIGDTVTIYKAAEIIPQIGTVLCSCDGASVEAPSVCPECGSSVSISGAYLVCPDEDCIGRRASSLQFFCSREHMDIRGIGDVSARALAMAGYRQDDLYQANLFKLVNHVGLTEGVAAKILEEIQKSKNKPFHCVLASLGIEGLGDVVSSKLVSVYGDIESILQVSKQDLEKLDGIGAVTAGQIYEGLHKPSVLRMLERLEEYGLAMKEVIESRRLDGMSFCVTGAVSVPRTVIKEKVEENGGLFKSSVSSGLTYLIGGEGGGKKREQAKKLGIEVITEQEFYALIGEAENG